VSARLREVSADWLPSVALAAVSAHELAYNHAGIAYWLLAQGLVWSLVVRRRAPEIVLATTVGLAAAGWATDTLLVAHLGVFVALHAVARWAPRVRAVVAAVVVEVAAVVAALQFSPTGSVNDGIVLLSGVTLAAYFLGTSQRTVQDSFVALEVRTAELERERELNAEMAAAAERTRIAREVHDVVAHSVSVMIALSEGAAATPDDA
jgi:signal transduction histidine kinase